MTAGTDGGAGSGTVTAEAPRRARGEPWSGLALMALGAYVVAQARGWDYLTPDGPGAGFFPLWYGIAIVALAAVVVASSLRTKGGARRAGWKGLRRALSTWVALAVAVAAFQVLGFVVGFALLTFYLVAVVYRRPWKVAALVAVASALGFWVAFPLALGVDLPVGILGF